jgi:hypothetical protein
MGARMDVFRALWVGDRLGAMEQLSIMSLRYFGYPFVLYSYGEVRGVPPGVELKDANEILPESDIFYYEDNGRSPACFANLFRYDMLYRYGGWWFDLDLACLKPLNFDRDYVMGWQCEDAVNNAIMKVPPGAPLMERLSAEARKVKGNEAVGITGPGLLTRVIREMDMWDCVEPKVSFYPIKWNHTRDHFTAGGTPPAESYTVHFWRSVLQRTGFAFGRCWPRDSIYETLRSKYMPDRCYCTGLCACGGEEHSFEGWYAALLDETRPKKVLEWGQGLSTRMALDIGARVFSLGTAGVFGNGHHANLSVLEAETGAPEYTSLSGVEDCDIYFVDARRRADCIRAVSEKCVNPEHALFLHDAQRERYGASLELYPFVLRPGRGTAIATKSRTLFERLECRYAQKQAGRPGEELC